MLETISKVAKDYKQEGLRAFHLFTSRQKIVFLGLFAAAAISLAGIFYIVNRSYTVVIPAFGGSFKEGVVGTPRFVNPVLAASDVDRDLTTLIYSGLMRVSPAGDVVPDLAKDFSVSEDGRTYLFHLKDNLTWHDGTPVTSEDIAFTIKQTQEPAIKSPKRASWEGVTIETPDAQQIIFTLKQPYGAFLENLTIGILPKHLWQNITAEAFPFHSLNIEAIGSGPYTINKIKRSNSGTPETYTLSAFRDFAMGSPHIKEITIAFYPNQQALLSAYENRAIESMGGVDPAVALSIDKIGGPIVKSTLPLPRVFAVFFNQNTQRVFTYTSARQALALAVDKSHITDNVFKGFATPVDGPIPPGALGYASSTASAVSGDRIAAAKAILEKDGWVYNGSTRVYEKTTPSKEKGKKETVSLSFSLATADTPELSQVASLLASDWEKLGAKVKLDVFEIGDLNQNVIRPRKYDALFFGEIVGRDPDPFSFWHSSQRLDPGLNVALYANLAVDKILETARQAADKQERADQYLAFQREIEKDTPAVFLYSPYFLYALPAHVQGITLDSITIPSERFTNIKDWYIETDRVWKIFTSSTDN